MERGVTDELVEVLKKKNVDFISFSQLIGISDKEFPLKQKLGLKSGMKTPRIKKILEKHLGDTLTLKRGKSYYLAFKQPDDVLVFRLLQKSAGNLPRLDSIPFKKSEFLDIVNRLIEQGTLRVKITKPKDYKPVLIPAETPTPPPKLPPHPEPRPGVSEEAFKEAYMQLERGRFYVRICNLRRHLGWGTQEFDKMMTGLRDAGKLQLQAGDTNFYTEEDVRNSFVDENGFTKLTVMWRQ
jgi:hypothetical protein